MVTNSPPLPEVLSQGELERIRELCEKATEGPWRIEAVSDAVRVCVGNGRSKIIVGRFCPPQLPEAETHKNARLCAESRSLIPALLDAISYLLGRNAEAVEEVDRLTEFLHGIEEHPDSEYIERYNNVPTGSGWEVNEVAEKHGSWIQYRRLRTAEGGTP